MQWETKVVHKNYYERTQSCVPMDSGNRSDFFLNNLFVSSLIPLVSQAPLYTTSQSRKKLGGPTLSIFGLSFGPKLLINCQNIDVRILINAGNIGPKGCKLASQIRFVSFFSNLGQMEKIFFQFILDSQCKTLGADFSFSTNRNA